MVRERGRMGGKERGSIRTEMKKMRKREMGRKYI